MVEEGSGLKTDVSQFMISVADVEASAGFYGGTLGLAEIDARSEPGERRFECANGIVIGIRPRDDGESGPGLGLVLRLDDIEALRARVEAAGVETSAVPGYPEGCSFADPDGIRIQALPGRGIAARMVSRSRIKDGRFLLEEEIRVRGCPADAWKALTDAALLSVWLCGGPASIAPRPGGRLELTFPHIGRPHTTWRCRILDFLPLTRFRFREEVLNLDVSFDLSPGYEGDTRILLTQTPLPLAEFDEDPRVLAQRLGLSWRRILRRLELLLEDELAVGEPGVREEDA